MRTNEEKHFEREFFYMAHGNLSYRSFFGMIIHFTIWSLVSGLFLYPLKTSQNLWFSDVFRGYRKRSVGLRHISIAWQSRSYDQGFFFPWPTFYYSLKKEKSNTNIIWLTVYIYTFLVNNNLYTIYKKYF